MMKSKAWLVVCCLATGCASGTPSTPAIWKVSDADNSVYLLGSFHALKAQDYPLSAPVLSAYADAERLAFEIAPNELQSPDLPAKMQQAAQLPPGLNLEELLPQAVWQQLQMWSRSNPAFPIASLNRLEPWYVAILVVNTQAMTQGFESGLGVDQHFMNAAKPAAKPSIGLEKVAQQIALFDGMPAQAQQQLLEEALDANIADNVHDLERLRYLWKTGDVDGLQRETVARMRREYPELYQSVNVDRNYAWLPQVQAMLDDEVSDDTMVVVGALHLLGDDGLVHLLREKGYRVERLK
ncbi:MAG: TraB/GumN family protein [Arenimonas sp.]|jgi:hypothetical protein|nr:TraB/GumN family protein [Arenimonas sp.]